jgi:hypothetical protein
LKRTFGRFKRVMFKMVAVADFFMLCSAVPGG